jgi:hypothetical protein
MHRRWLRTALIVFAAGIVIRALVERRPDKLHLIGIIAGIGVAVLFLGWLFAARKR